MFLETCEKLTGRAWEWQDRVVLVSLIPFSVLVSLSFICNVIKDT